MKPKTSADVRGFDENFWSLVADEVRGFVEREIASLRNEFEMKLDKAYGAQGTHEPDRELGALRERIKALENRPQIVDRGVWCGGATYKNGSVCSHDGSLWIAQTDTASRPGTDDTWRLAVKKGRDARSHRG